MSAETARALEQSLAVNDLQRKEIESLRAVLVHIKLDIEEWRSGDNPAWSATVLEAIEKRVGEKLHEPPTVIDGNGAPSEGQAADPATNPSGG